jgi:hypothetical protein
MWISPLTDSMKHVVPNHFLRRQAQHGSNRLPQLATLYAFFGALY